MNTKIIKFDINKNLYDTLLAKQGDTKSRFLLFNLLDGSIPFSLENRSVRVYAIKPDGTEVFNDLIITDTAKGYCILELTNQILAVAGTIKLELMVIEGDKKLTSNIFYMDVKESINSEKAIVSTNEFGTLLTALASLNEYDNYKNEIAAARDGEKNLLTKVKKIDEQLDTIDNRLDKVIQINLWDYKEYKNGSDWSPAIERLLLENTKGEILIPWSITPFEFSRSITLNEDNSLKIDIGAIIKATEEMDVFIKHHRNFNNMTRNYNFYNAIYGRGIIDCNGKAKIGISLGGYRFYTLEGLTILDMSEIGIITKGEDVDYAVELMASKLRIEVRENNTSINPIGIKVNSSDNHFKDILIVDCIEGIQCVDFSNRFVRCHHWMRDRIINKDIGCISFNDTGAFNTYDTCYADTSNIGFSTGGGNTFKNCEYFNSQHFNALNSVAIKLNKEITSLLIFDNFKCRGDGAVANVKKVIDQTTAIINDNCRFKDFYVNHLVEEGMQDIAKNYDNKFAFLECTGDTRTKVLRATDKVQCPNYNFSDTQWLNCTSDDIVRINSHVIPKFIVNAPSNSKNEGKHGFFVYDNSKFYFYHNGLKEWVRIPFERW